MNRVASSDEELMAWTAKGDGYAFELLVRRHQAFVMNLIYRYVGDRARAKDLAQEVFLRIWRAARSYEPEAKFTTWIYRITVNLCLNELKSGNKNKLSLTRGAIEEIQTLNEEITDVSPSAEDVLLAEERSRQISKALQGLPENQRMALILKRYDNLTYDEISKILECSVSAVESLLVRAKRNLQEKLIFPKK
jgi:RNA polymerase sigma-70 factor, ECF subfamily